MIILPFLTLLLIAAFFAGNIIKKHSVKLYAAATIIAVLAFILKDKQFMALSFKVT